MRMDRIQVLKDPIIMDDMAKGIKKFPKDESPQKSLLGIWKDFGDNTTMHGLGRAVGGQMLWKQVVWSLLVTGAACIACMGVYESITTYLSYPVATTVELQSRRKMVFPAVTICNLNPARLSALDRRIRNKLNDQVENGKPAAKLNQLYKLELNRIYGTEKDEFKDGIYHSMEDMLVDCEFDSMPCEADEFEASYNYLYGKCFTFNSNQTESKQIERPGDRNGLVLELDIQQDQYLPFISTSGIKVLVHPQSDIAFPEDSGIIVGPGKATSIGIRKLAVTRQPPPWGQCLSPERAKDRRINMFAGRHKYTLVLCEKTCYQMSVVHECLCCDESYPCNETALLRTTRVNLEGIDECDESNRTTLHCLTRIRRQYYSGDLHCMRNCLPSCQETSYKINYATGTWPGSNFERTLISKIKKSMRTSRASSPPDEDQITSSFIANNFLRLEVYFENFVEEIVVTNPAFGWNKLFSDIGGQLGLMLGFSILTAVELLELLHDVVGFISRRIQTSRNLKTSPNAPT